MAQEKREQAQRLQHGRLFDAEPRASLQPRLAQRATRPPRDEDSRAARNRRIAKAAVMFDTGSERHECARPQHLMLDRRAEIVALRANVAAVEPIVERGALAVP